MLPEDGNRAKTGVTVTTQTAEDPGQLVENPGQLLVDPEPPAEVPEPRVVICGQMPIQLTDTTTYLLGGVTSGRSYKVYIKEI